MSTGASCPHSGEHSLVTGWGVGCQARGVNTPEAPPTLRGGSCGINPPASSPTLRDSEVGQVTRASPGAHVSCSPKGPFLFCSLCSLGFHPLCFWRSSPSEISYLPSNPCFRPCFWGSPLPTTSPILRMLVMSPHSGGTCHSTCTSLCICYVLS